MMKHKNVFICKWCGQEFSTYEKRIRKFCSLAHFRLWSKGNINKKPISDDKKRKISDYWKGRKKGPNSKKHNKNISIARKGIKFSKEHKRKLSLAKIKKYSLNKCPFIGKQQIYISLKTKEKNMSHSSYELEMMKKFDENNNILYWTKNHNIKIPYMLEGSEHNYLPDFLVLYKDGSRELIEVKGYIYNKIMFEAKNAACDLYCKNNNIKYRILFKEDIYEQKV